MGTIRAVLVLVVVGCVDTPPTAVAACVSTCGPMPEAPLFEYTEHAGAPAEAHLPLHQWLQDLAWRDDVRTWAACVTGAAPIATAGR